MRPQPSARAHLIAGAMLARLRPLWPWVYRLMLVATCISAFSYGLRSVWAFTIDDAGISYAYAKHIAEGLGPVAAPGAPWVEGYSNPLWVLLLVPFHALGLPLPLMAKVLGTAACAATLVAASVCLRPRDGRRWYAIGATEALYAVLLTACLECIVWVVAGLENPLFMFLLVLLAALSRGDGSSRLSQAFAGLAAFGLSITRPEGLLYVSAWAALELGAVLKLGAVRWRPRAGALTSLLFFVVPLALYHSAHYLVFREIVPNTYLAKPPSPDWQRGLSYLRTELQGSGLGYVIPLALVGALRDVRNKLLLVWDCCAGAAFVLYSGGDWMPHGRFIALFAPALLLLAAHGADNVVYWAAPLARGRLPRESLALGVAGLLGALWWSHQAPRLEKQARQPWCHFCDRLADAKKLAKLSRRAGLSAVSVVTHDFGGPAWSSSPAFYPIDFLGLCDRSVALVRRDRVRRRGSIGDEPRMYQYLMHEQPSPPSLLYLPANFWPRLERSPEYRAGYLQLSRSLLPKAPPNTLLGLHRSELVDYFPPTESFQFRSLGSNLALLGSAAFLALSPAPHSTNDEVRAGAELRVLLSVLPRGRFDGKRQLALRVEAGGERVQSTPRALMPFDVVAGQLREGDPIALELGLTLPRAAEAGYALSLGVSSGAARGAASVAEPEATDWVWTSLGNLTQGSRLPRDARRALPRFPAALPSATDPDLRGYQAPVARIDEARRRAGDMTLGDRDLSRQLMALGEKLEQRGLVEQAYLANVWATQAWRESWRELADPIYRQRPALRDGQQAMELALLGDYYASGDAAALTRLIAYLVLIGAQTEVEYFLEHVPSYRLEPALQAAFDRMRRATLSPAPARFEGELPSEIVHDPLGSLDFETATLDGWQGNLDAFRAGDAPEHRRPALRGQHGQGLLSSLGGGKRARGELLSPEFTLDGSRLSLLVAGSRRGAGVELLVDGRAVASARGNDSDSFYPELWNVAAHQGRRARLRLFDTDVRAYVLIDRVLSWR